MFYFYLIVLLAILNILSISNAQEEIFTSTTKTIKIVDGAPLTQTAPSAHSTIDASITSALPPFPYVAPSSLYFLSNICLPYSYERFEYVLCPFQNITQRRTIGNHMINLGTWGHWVTEDKRVEGSTTRSFTQINFKDLNKFKLQRYTNGKACGDTENNIESTIEFVCEHPTPKGVEVLGLDDSFCKFNFKVGINAPCTLFQNYDIMT